MVDESLKNYIETSIFPLYDDLDVAHQRDHVEMVIKLSLSIAENLNVNMDMVYATAAYHDTGLVKENKNHNITSGNIVREDMWLRDWFTEQQIETIAQAVEDHYMASGNEPRNIYGKIIAKATPMVNCHDRVLCGL